MSLKINTVIGGRYIIKGNLGQGGMADVYMAEHQKLGTLWAIKQMLDNFGDNPKEYANRVMTIEQFNIEAKMLAQLNHINLPKVIDFFEDRGSYFIVMEYIDGETLNEIRIKAKPDFLPEHKVIEWLIDVCFALDYLHNNKPNPIIFRDLKPKNIMLSRENIIKLIDFGIAKIFEPDSRTQTIIRGSGTAGFSPPEQYGSISTDPRSDIYALGATMYVLLTHAKCPNSIDRMVDKVTLIHPRQINQNISPGIENCILKAMELKRNERFQTVMEMKDELDYCIKNPVSKTIITHPPPVVKENKKPLQKPVIKENTGSLQKSGDKENTASKLLSVTGDNNTTSRGNTSRKLFARKPATRYTFISKWGQQGIKDGDFYGPSGIAVSITGYVYVVDSLNHRVQKFDSNGNFIMKWGTEGNSRGQFNYPEGIGIDSSENIYVADRDNHRIQKFNSKGNFITKWSEGNNVVNMLKSLIGSLIDKGFTLPYGISTDKRDNIYVTDKLNHCIYKFDHRGNYKIKFGRFGSGDGELHSPKGIAVDSSGNIYISDCGNERIQKFDEEGNFITRWGFEGSGDGEFRSPCCIGIDDNDYLYITDYGNDRIQKFDASGNFITKLGSRGYMSGDFTYPVGIAIDKDGNIYVTDSDNHRVQKFKPEG